MSEKKHILIHGRLGKNPDLSYTKKLEPVCELVLTESIEGQEKPQWHKVIVWGKQAEICTVHLKTGSTLFVRGRNIEREYINLTYPSCL